MLFRNERRATDFEAPKKNVKGVCRVLGRQLTIAKKRVFAHDFVVSKN